MQDDPPAETTPPEGRYTNYFKVGHSPFEFILDFGQFYPKSGRAQMHSRIITSPTYAKELAHTLGTSLKGYEDTFGPIPSLENETSPDGPPDQKD